MVGDIVLLKVDVHPSNWPMAKIICVCPDKDGVVQNVQLLIGLYNGTKTVLDRLIHKMFTCRGRGTFNFPTRRLRKINMIQSLERSHM